MEKALYVGIDAGGTKTAGLLADAEGRVLARDWTGGVPLDGAPRPQQCLLLARLRDSLARQAGVPVEAVTRVGLGVHGVGDFQEDWAPQHQGLAQGLDLDPDRLVLANDGVAALWGATDAPAAAILQYGTGCVGAWRGAPGREQIFDSMGLTGLADLRADALRLVARMLMGLRPATPLMERLMDFWGVSCETDLVQGWFRDGLSREQKANTPPLVFAAWLEGDAGAVELVERAADDYSLAAAELARRSGAEHPVVCFGGGVLLRAPGAFHALLAGKLHERSPGARVEAPRLPPEAGACLMAAALDGDAPFKGLEEALGSVSVAGGRP